MQRAFETIENSKAEKAEHRSAGMLLRAQAFVPKGKRDKTRFSQLLVSMER
jgi:hypothetical protein